MKQKFIYIFLLYVYSYSANAALIYNEAIDGDIFSVVTFSSLGIGTNTVTGSMSFYGNLDDGGDYDTDTFDIYIPANTVLSSVAIEAQWGHVGSSGDFTNAEVSFALYCSYQNSNVGSTGCTVHNPSPLGDATYLYTFATQVLSSTSYSLDSLTNLPGNTYYTADAPSVIGWAFPSYTQPWTGSGTFNYTYTFEVANVSTVPVPAAFWLFGSGLVGLFGIARRKADKSKPDKLVRL